MTELLLHINGIQAGFDFELGVESPRADEGRAGNRFHSGGSA